MEVYTFGNMDFLFQVFTAVKQLMGTSDYMTLVRLTILLGFLILAYQVFFSLRIDIVASGFLKQYLIVIIAFYVLLVPKTDVVIRDEIRNQQVSVQSVPYGIGMVAHFFTTMEKGLTTLIETYFTTPDDMKFSKTGYAFSTILLDNLRFATPTDPYYKRTLNDYIVNCFFSDVVWGDIDLGAFIQSNNIMADMAPQHSRPLFTMVYNAAAPAGTAKTCQDAYTTDVFGPMATEATTSLTALNKVMQVDVTGRIATVVNSYLNMGAGSATDVIQQAMAANAVKEGLAQTALYSGVSADAVMYSSALAEQQQASSWIVAGELSKRYIPIIRQVFEALIYGLFPIIFLMMMTPMGVKAVRIYFSLLVWLLMWSPLYALLNLIVNTRTTGVLAASWGQFSLGQMPYIYQSTSDLTAMAGYLAWAVPTLAFAVAKGSDSALVHLASGIQTSTNLSTSHAAGATTGTEGATRMAAASAHFKAAQTYGGADVVAAGTAAQAFMGHASAVELSTQGEGRLAQAGRGAAMNSVVIGVGQGSAIDRQGGIDSAAASVSNQQEKSLAYGHEIGPGGALGQFAGRVDTGRMNGYQEAYRNWQSGGHHGSMVDMLSSTEGSSMIKNTSDRQAYRDVLNSRSDYHQSHNPGMDRDQAVATAATEFAQIEASRKHGGDIGWQRSYDTARAHGFEGSEMQYASFLSEMSNVRSYADSASLQKVADKYWGGDTANMLEERANYHNTQASAEIQKMQQSGFTAAGIGKYTGEVAALKAIASSDFYQQFGDRGILTSEGGKMQNELAKFDMLERAAVASGYGSPDGSLSKSQFQNFLQDHHGVDIKYGSKDGINTFSMTHEGKEIYREQRGQIDMNNPSHQAMIREAQKDNPNFNPQQGDTFHVGGGPVKKFATAHSTGGAVSQHNNRDELNAMNTVQKGTTSTIGNFGDVVLGDSQQDKAFIKTFNAQLNQQVAAFQKEHPEFQLDSRYVESLKLQPGDHVRYSSSPTGLSSFSIERGGNKAISYTSQNSFGTSSAIKQGRVEYTGGTEGQGYVTGTIGQVLRNAGASEETARKWEARGAAFLGFTRELLPAASAVKGMSTGKGGGVKADGPYSPVGWRYPEQ